MLACEWTLGEERLDRAVHAFDDEAEAGGHDAHRLREADVPEDSAGVPTGSELVGREPDAETAQHRRAEEREIYDARDANPFDVGRSEREGRHQGVEDEARVGPASDDRDVSGTRHGVEPRRELIVDAPRECRFLCGAQDVVTGGHRGLDGRSQFAKERCCRNDCYIG